MKFHNSPVLLPFGEYYSQSEVQKAKLVHVRDQSEELVSFKPQYVLPKALYWLRNYSVVESRFDSETEELFIKIV